MREPANSFRLASVLICSIWLSVASTSLSQPLSIVTLAGSSGQGAADGSSNTARFYQPQGIATDNLGNIYVANTANHTIREITSTGVVSTLAGLAGVSGSSDGMGSNALFFQPQGLAVDNSGNVYVADTGNHTIRQISLGGVVVTVAGLAGISGSVDGSGTNARFFEPEGVAVDAGTNLYVADTWNHTIRQITPGGTVSTLAGSPGNFGSMDATGTNAQFYQPQGIAVDTSGNIFVADAGNETIRKIAQGAIVTTVAGLPGSYGSSNATGTNAQFYSPRGVAVDASGNLYVSDYFNQTIRKVSTGGVVSTLAGWTGNFGSSDGTGTNARFYGPQGVAVSSNVVYVADTGNGTIRKVTSGGAVTTFAGSAGTGNIDGAGTAARFYWPGAVVFDSAGNLYLADTENCAIRKITTNGTVSTLAGLAGVTGTNDGTGTNARFFAPEGISSDTAGNLYVADTGNHTIRKVTGAGAVTTLAGAPGTNGITDGTTSAARFNSPQGLAVDKSGNLYVADTGNDTIRKVTSSGVVTTLAGWPGHPGCIDGGAVNVGTNASQFNAPRGIAVDGASNVYVADTWNGTIRKATPTGVVSTLAGTPGVCGAIDATNAGARFFQPQGITVDSVGSLYVVDSGNHTIRKVVASGTNWVVSTVAGLSEVGGSADGVGYGAQFCSPAAIAVNSAGTFAVADRGNNLLRTGSVAASGAVTITAEPLSQTVNQDSNVTFTVAASGTAPLGYQWLFNGGSVGGAAGSNFTVLSVQTTNAGSYSVLVANPFGKVTSSNAVLAVNPAPIITNQPVSLICTQGGTANFSVLAGPAPLSYQWQKNGTNLTDGGTVTGSSTAALTLSNLTANDAASYTVALSNIVGTTFSVPATLTVLIPPTILAQPQSATVLTGDCNDFSISATGTMPLTYIWRWNNFTFAPGGSTFNGCNAGNYSCIVSNAVGVTTSAVVALVVTDALPGKFDSIVYLTNGSVLLNMSGTPGTNYTLLWTTDWVSWPSFGALSGSNGLFNYVDPSVANSNFRFYKLRLGP